MADREIWATRTGFILASVGCAIGLGNIWMFPWRLGAYGGAAYLIVFLIFIFAIAAVGLMAEFALGRSHRKGALDAITDIFKEKGYSPTAGTVLGLIPVLGVSGVFVFYIIVVGWVTRFFILSIQGFAGVDAGAAFGGLAGQPSSIIWHVIAMVITLLIVQLGIQRGIEKANKIMLPILFILFVIVMIRSLTLPGSFEGVRFLLVPDWSLLGNSETWVMALGQAFFTVSLGGAGMVVYGSYLSKKEDIPSAAINVVIYDTLAGLLAAFMIFPAVFAFGMDPAAGPPLLFITLPSIIPLMPGGYFFGIVLFAGLMCAVYSSIVNLMEVPVEAIMSRFNMSRRNSVLLVAGLGFLIGLPLDLSMPRFGMFADIVSIYLIPFGAVIAAFVFFWIYGAAKAREEINLGASKPVGPWLEPYTKYLYVGVTLIILILGIMIGGF